MSDEPKTDGEDALQADPASKSGEGSTGGLPDEGIEGDEGRGTPEGAPVRPAAQAARALAADPKRHR